MFAERPVDEFEAPGAVESQLAEQIDRCGELVSNLSQRWCLQIEVVDVHVTDPLAVCIETGAEQIVAVVGVDQRTHCFGGSTGGRHLG